MHNNLHRVVTHRDDLLVTYTTAATPKARTQSALKINSVNTDLEVTRMRRPRYQQQHDH
jgi:hypothetical protein